MVDGNLSMQNSQQYNSEKEFNEAWNAAERLDAYQPLLNLLSKEHGLIPLQSGMDEIIKLCNEFLFGKYWNVEQIENILLLDDEQINEMYPIENSSGTKLDGNACRREALKEYNERIINLLSGN